MFAKETGAMFAVAESLRSAGSEKRHLYRQPIS